MVKKFGLDELQKYTDEVGFKSGDIRTIKGVLAIVGIPNVIVAEAKRRISDLAGDVVGLLTAKESLLDKDAEDEVVIKGDILNLRRERNERKGINQISLVGTARDVKLAKDRIRKLEDTLKRFS